MRVTIKKIKSKTPNKKNIFFNINAILMLIYGCHGKTEDAEEKDASIE